MTGHTDDGKMAGSRPGGCLQTAAKTALRHLIELGAETPRVGVSAVATIRLLSNEPQRAGAVNFPLDIGVFVVESLPSW